MVEEVCMNQKGTVPCQVGTGPLIVILMDDNCDGVDKIAGTVPMCKGLSLSLWTIISWLAMFDVCWGGVKHVVNT